jgi:hypothetical protein
MRVDHGHPMQADSELMTVNPAENGICSGALLDIKYAFENRLSTLISDAVTQRHCTYMEVGEVIFH